MKISLLYIVVIHHIVAISNEGLSYCMFYVMWKKKANKIHFYGKWANSAASRSNLKVD